ncbi:TonB-dependent siderophore receptor [Lutibacter sp.]|uniref:TonB-dependent receptor plug domain-containing protein n=1 Tax=Lutibacter sp. TaxID=1925666 RepID=UPI0027330EC7|nr:TonB-dependent receptor [Lutibacter sp.]MDP3311917.1 TonB-dependent receptor [Lutibacter sp.]
MKKRSFYVSVICMFLIVSTLKAQEKTEKVEELKEVVLVATKFAIEKEKIGKVIYQIKAEDLVNLQGKTVADVLDNLAGIQINGNNSSAGKNKSAFVRGGRGYQTLVLIDGVPLSDPSGINNEFDLRLLTISQIESIEIMNGAASTLYGSGAATGVINIKLKESEKKSISLHYQVSAGTNNSQKENSINLLDFNQNIALNGSLKKFNYLVSVNASNINGLSEASDEKSAIKFENDKFQPINSYVRMGYNFSNNWSVTLFNNYDKDVYDYDGGAFTDSDINKGKNTQNRFGLTSNFKYNKGNLKLVASFNKNERTFDSFNAWTNGVDHFEYEGESLYADVVNDYKFSEKFQLITGVNFQDQNNKTSSPYGNIDESVANYNTIDPYFTVVYNSTSGFNINSGVRLNLHSEYGNHLVYNVNPSYNFSNNLRLITSYSTAFIAPSTYQLFSQYGNLDLKPEEDSAFEAGFIYSIKKEIELNTVFFYREISNAIILPDYITYQNANKTINAKGIESELKIDVIKDVNFKLGYTYTNKSADFDYIPKNKFTAMVETTVLKNTYLSLNFKNISQRTYFDQWGTGSNIELAAYNLVDFYGSYSIIKNKILVFAQINNIFNNGYVETIGYTTKGRNFKIGLDFKF